MSTMSTITENDILQALREVPSREWENVLDFVHSLRPASEANRNGSHPIVTAVDLAKSDLVGIWADRQDIVDSREFARKLRENAQQR